MITWETKVNGILISHITATRKNVCSTKENEFLYRYEYYELGKAKLFCGYVSHDPNNGSYDLLKQILTNVKRKKKNEREDN